MGPNFVRCITFPPLRHECIAECVSSYSLKVYKTGMQLVRSVQTNIKIKSQLLLLRLKVLCYQNDSLLLSGRFFSQNS
jgi:hypothetical protein